MGILRGGCRCFAAGAGDRVQADTGCDRGVQRLHHGRDRNAGDRVARLAHESAQSLAFRTEHDDQRIGLETGFADQLIAAAVEADRVISTFAHAFDGLGEVHHASHRDMRRGTG